MTGDRHIKFRLIETSDHGENQDGSLNHPVRLFRLMQREHVGFTGFDRIEGEIGYLDILVPPESALDTAIVLAWKADQSYANRKTNH